MRKRLSRQLFKSDIESLNNLLIIILVIAFIPFLIFGLFGEDYSGITLFGMFPLLMTAIMYIDRIKRYSKRI